MIETLLGATFSNLFESAALKVKYEECLIQNAANPERVAICKCKVYNQGCYSAGNIWGDILGAMGL
jgi:hypothetical protein